MGSSASGGPGAGNWQGENANPNARSRRYAWQRTTDEAYYGGANDSRDGEQEHIHTLGTRDREKDVDNNDHPERHSRGRTRPGVEPDMGMGEGDSVDADVDAEVEGEVEGEDTETYCYCNRVSFGEMLACDGPNCDMEWVCISLPISSDGLFADIESVGYSSIYRVFNLNRHQKERGIAMHV